jgi:hypothetical protein
MGKLKTNQLSALFGIWMLVGGGAAGTIGIFQAQALAADPPETVEFQFALTGSSLMMPLSLNETALQIQQDPDREPFADSASLRYLDATALHPPGSRLAAFLEQIGKPVAIENSLPAGIPWENMSVIHRGNEFKFEDAASPNSLNPFLDIQIRLPESRYDRLPDDDPTGPILFDARIPPPDRTQFDWNGALGQSFLFLTGLHTLRIAMQPETRAELGGPFWKDYARTVSRLSGWSDGDTVTTNYVLHPMMGAVAGFIEVQNDPTGKVADFGTSSDYRNSRLKAFAWATAFSFMFELGPLSEADIGNVGMHPRESSEHPMAWVDLVVTPVMGTVWMLGEDALDRHLVNRIEDTDWNRHLKATFRVALNPCRSIANIARLKVPWHRD